MPKKDVESAAIAGKEGLEKSEVEAWELRVDDLQIPAGKLVAVVGQVCMGVMIVLATGGGEGGGGGLYILVVGFVMSDKE